MESEAGCIVLPGDTVGHVGTAELRVGPGLMQSTGERVVATRSGELCYKARHAYWWVEHAGGRRYVPALEDLVVGTVVGQTAEMYTVDIGAAGLATLRCVEGFEGATKRNRPHLATGALVYARVVAAARDLDAELECMSVRKRADGFGELTGGHVVRCSLGLARSLLDPRCAVLACLGELLPYEVAVGMNGRVWVKAGTPREMVLVANAILNSETLTVPEIKAMVTALFQRLNVSASKPKTEHTDTAPVSQN